jgi:hypothetical protein
MTSSRRYDDDDDDDERRYALTNQDFRDASEQLLFVFPELRGSFRSPTTSSTLESHRASVNSSNNRSAGIMAVGDRHSGVLWKRRDVFKNRWRPRWFVLNPGQGILTYYLLNAAAVALPSSSSASPATTTTTTTPRMRTPDDSQHSNGSRNNINTPTSPHHQQQQQRPSPSSSSSSNHPRRGRTTSWDSQVSGVSENSVDYDVVPRGTIFLLGCTVAVNDLLSKPSEHLYAFTIQPPSSSTESRVHLAARTVQARQIWVERIAIVCHRRPPPPPVLFPQQQQAPSLPTPTHFLQSPSTTLYQQQHSIPEDDVLHVVDDSPVSNNSNSSSRLNQWSTLGPTERLYQHLSASLITMIQEKINTYLPMCCCPTAVDDFLQRSPWKMIMQNDTIVAAVTTDGNTGRSIVQSRKRYTDLPVLHIFSLLIDISRRHLYESNVQIDERVQILNDHTFLDYYSYKAVRCFFLFVVCFVDGSSISFFGLCSL